MASIKRSTCLFEASSDVRTGRLVSAAVVGALLSGCQADAGGKPNNDLYELVHRYVMASPLLDECIEEHGLGPKNRFEMMLEIHPSGELVPLEVKEGNEDLNSCLEEEIPKIRLPEGSVAEIEMVPISIR